VCHLLTSHSNKHPSSSRFQIGGGSSTAKLLFLSCNLFWFAMSTKLMALCGGVQWDLTFDLMSNSEACPC
jgi:hypothetical protein